MKSNRTFLSLAIGVALMTSLAACSNTPAPSSGDAMKKDGDAMKSDAMKGGDAMKKDGDAMKGDAMKGTEKK